MGEATTRYLARQGTQFALRAARRRPPRADVMCHPARPVWRKMASAFRSTSLRRVAAPALACAAVLAGCGGKDFTPSTAVVDFPSGQPGKGKPAVTLGTKNFTEELILGQLYTQALQAKGYTVHLRANIGPTEAVEPELLAGHIDGYPEYTGVIVSTLANINLGTGGTGGRQAG